VKYEKKKPKILIDSDVMRHFIDGSFHFYLPKIYPKRIVFVDIVKLELCKSKKYEKHVKNYY